MYTKIKLRQFKFFYNVFFILCTLVLLAYVVLRAKFLSFTFDESVSYTILQNTKYWINTPNNHLLNTELMKVFDTLFGTSEFLLRLPNVLSFLLYLTGSYFIFKKNKRIWLSLFGLILVLFNPFLIEFFSLARGYGISMGFLLVSLALLFRNEVYKEKPTTFLNDFFFSLVFAAIGIYANLALINYYICVIVIFIYKYLWLLRYQQKNRIFNILFWITVSISTVPLYLGVSRLLMLKAKDQLYFGSSSMIDSLQSLLESSFFLKESTPIVLVLINIFVITTILMGVIHIVLTKSYNSFLFHVLLLILLLSIGLYAEHILFDAKYPKSRTALFYIPLLSIYFYQFFSTLVNHYEIQKRVYIPFISLFCLTVLMNFIWKANLSHTTTWKHDAWTKEAMNKVKDRIKNEKHGFTMSCHWLFKPTTNFYIDLWGLNITPPDRNGVDKDSDFIYRLENTSKIEGFTVIHHFEDIDSQLLIKTRLIEN